MTSPIRFTAGPNLKYGVDYLNELKAQPGGNLPVMNDSTAHREIVKKTVLTVGEIASFATPIGLGARGVKTLASVLEKPAKLLLNAAEKSKSTAIKGIEGVPVRQMPTFSSQAGFIKPSTTPLDKRSWVPGCVGGALGTTWAYTAETKIDYPVSVASAGSMGMITGNLGAMAFTGSPKNFKSWASGVVEGAVLALGVRLLRDHVEQKPVTTSTTEYATTGAAGIAAAVATSMGAGKAMHHFPQLSTLALATAGGAYLLHQYKKQTTQEAVTPQGALLEQ